MMEATYFFIGLYALLGAAVGSFLNVCTDRVPEGLSLVSPPSHCPSCERRLRPLELVPIFSYLALRGRCQTCGARIPFRVFLVELGTAGWFGLLAWRFGPTFETLRLSAFSALLIPIALIDLDHKRIPNRLIYPGLALAALAIPFSPSPGSLALLLGGAGSFLIFFALAWLSKAGMGMGDVKLAAFIGLTTGHPLAWLALLLGFILGGLVAGVLLTLRRVGRKDPIPLGPFLAAATLITYVWGESILSWWIARL